MRARPNVTPRIVFAQRPAPSSHRQFHQRWGRAISSRFATILPAGEPVVSAQTENISAQLAHLATHALTPLAKGEPPRSARPCQSAVATLFAVLSREHAYVPARWRGDVRSALRMHPLPSRRARIVHIVAFAVSAALLLPAVLVALLAVVAQVGENPAFSIISGTLWGWAGSALKLWFLGIPLLLVTWLSKRAASPRHILRGLDPSGTVVARSSEPTAKRLPLGRVLLIAAGLVGAGVALSIFLRLPPGFGHMQSGPALPSDLPATCGHITTQNGWATLVPSSAGDCFLAAAHGCVARSLTIDEAGVDDQATHVVWVSPETRGGCVIDDHVAYRNGNNALESCTSVVVGSSGAFAYLAGCPSYGGGVEDALIALRQNPAH